MSSTEMPYSWKRARAIRCRTLLLGGLLERLLAGDEVEDEPVAHHLGVGLAPAGFARRRRTRASATGRRPVSDRRADVTGFRSGRRPDRPRRPRGRTLFASAPTRPHAGSRRSAHFDPSPASALCCRSNPPVNVPTTEPPLPPDLERRYLPLAGHRVDRLLRDLEQSRDLPERQNVVRRQGTAFRHSQVNSNGCPWLPADGTPSAGLIQERT